MNLTFFVSLVQCKNLTFIISGTSTMSYPIAMNQSHLDICLQASVEGQRGSLPGFLSVGVFLPGTNSVLYGMVYSLLGSLPVAINVLEININFQLYSS